eukprot:4198894-Amphidinium_carterae.1
MVHHVDVSCVLLSSANNLAFKWHRSLHVSVQAITCSRPRLPAQRLLETKSSTQQKQRVMAAFKPTRHVIPTPLILGPQKHPKK